MLAAVFNLWGSRSAGPSSEQNLLPRLRRGEPEAFAALVDAQGPLVLRLARRYAASEADAEDLTQEIFVALFQAVAGFRGEAQLSTWVYRVALNHCLKHTARRKPDPVPLDDRLPLADSDGQNSPHSYAANRELAQQVEVALAELSDGHREVVILHELHGLTYAECAEVLQIPVGTVKSRLFHAFGRLRETLGAYVRGEEETPGLFPGGRETAHENTTAAAAVAGPRFAVPPSPSLTETRS